MPALALEAVAGLHPYGTLETLAAFLAEGQKPFHDRGMAECPADSFARLKSLGPSLRRMPRLARLALAAALELPHFREETPEATENSALVVATSFGSVVSTFDFMDSLLTDGPGMASPTAFSHSVTNMTAAMLGQHLRLTGPATTVTDAGGNPLVPALLAAAGILGSGDAERVFLCAVEESQPTLNQIAAAHSAIRPGMEGAVLFVLTRGCRETCPHVIVPPFGAAALSDIPAAYPAVDVYGPGTLAFAWNIALCAFALQNGGAGPFRCQAGTHPEGSVEAWLATGANP